jgi:hypothetical protein
MSRPLTVAVALVVMVALIVGVDMTVLRHHVWTRLAVNVGIVLVCAVLYLRFVHGR